MSTTALRQSVISLIQGKVKGKTYIIVATLISRNKPRGIVQIMAIGKDNLHLVPKEATHVFTIKETNTPVTIVLEGDVLYVVE